MDLRTLYKLAFLEVIALALVSGCEGTRPRASIERPMAFLTDEEQSFISEASEIQRLLWDGRIDYDEFRKIHNAHKQWQFEKNNVKVRPTPSIGSDNERVREKLTVRGHLNSADLRGLDLRWSYLVGAHLNGANLSGTGTEATLVPAGSETNRLYRLGIDLSQANLVGAEVGRATGKESLLRFSLLIGTDFSETNLSGAVLRGVDARWATFQGTDLTNADFQLAKVAGAVYEPKPNALPNVGQMAYADGLYRLTYLETPAGLVELRNAFYVSGFGRQARQVTYAIRRTERLGLWNGGPLERLESIASFAFFEITSAYGMAPYRPLLILLLLIPVFSIAYVFAILDYGNGTIWANRPHAAVNRRVLESWIRIRFRRDRNNISEIFRVLRIAGCFSVLCAFRIGFREFNVGDWISRLQSPQYELRATGWTRSVAGCQALVSLYLLALSALCFLGRPFG